MQKNKNIVKIYADGACSGNPGPGGYAAIVRFKKHEKIVSGYEPITTNNRMELLAVIKALESLKRPCNVIITTDSQYVVKGITQWIQNWIKNNWLNSKKKEVENKDLWERLYDLSKPHNITWHWIEGHKGHVENEKCDKIAKEMIKANRI